MATSEDKAESMRRFGEELKRRRLDAGYRLGKDFANIVGVSGGYISNLETAYTKASAPPTVPALEILNKISEVLKWPKVDMLLLMGFMDESDLAQALSIDSDYEPILEEMRGAAHDGSLSPDDAEEIAEIIRLRRARRRRALG